MNIDIEHEIILTYANLYDFFGSTELEYVEDEDGDEILKATFYPLIDDDLDEVWERWCKDNPNDTRKRPSAEDFNDAILSILHNDDEIEDIEVIDPEN